ncbi:TPA: hypothetical protein R4Y92_001419 [Klebsiella aerogenes]|nr:hypothetical protein [Klebsiella aerogenes]
MTLEKIDVNGFIRHQEQLARQVYIRDGHIMLSAPSGDLIPGDEEGREYDISLKTCATGPQILSWAFQLTNKEWVTTEMLHRFIQLAAENAGIPL